MMNNYPNNRPAVVAAMAASFLVLTFGLTYRVLAAWLLTPVSNSPIVSKALVGFPIQIGDWTGQDLPLDQSIVRTTSTDVHINRRYSRRDGVDSIMFYVGCGANVAQVLTHRPEICYIAFGWTLIDRRSGEVPFDDGTKLPCSILKFSGGLWGTERIVVLSCFIADGQYYSDSSMIRSRRGRRFTTVSYAGQIQVVASAETQATDSAENLVLAFAVDSAPSIAHLFEDIEKDRNSSQSQELPEGK